jgi:hypothetical protein
VRGSGLASGRLLRSHPGALAAVVMALSALAFSLPGIMHAAWAASDPSLPASEVSVGPAPMDTSGTESPVAGKISSIVVDPADPNTLWVGSANGGVWKTADVALGAPDPPHWAPTSDHLPSLSIGALALDPTDGTGATLVAGFGATSSNGGRHGPLVGLARTTDGGGGWALRGSQLAGETVSGVAPRGAVIVVGSKAGQGGLWRSCDTGLTFARISDDAMSPANCGPHPPSGLPDANVSSLVGDPAAPARLFAGLTGTGGGVWRSDDVGATWTKMGTLVDAGGHDLAVDARKIEVAVAPGPLGTTVVDVAVIAASGDLGALAQTFLADGVWSGTWTSILPVPSGIETRQQGQIALTPDPTVANLVYVAGDNASVHRCDFDAATNPCVEISGPSGTADGSKPHTDAATMAFDGSVLLETNDGGVYERTNPRDIGGQGVWQSKNGNLAITEGLACAYDTYSHVSLCGTQDNGLAQQRAEGERTWDELIDGDGAGVAVSDTLATCPSSVPGGGLCSTRYYSLTHLGSLSRESCNSFNLCDSPGPNPALVIMNGPNAGQPLQCPESGGSPAGPCTDSGIGYVTPIAADRFDPQRLAIAANNVYDSTDGGETVYALDGFSGAPTGAIAYGGRAGGVDNPDVLYVGSTAGLFLRTAGAPPGAGLHATSYPGTRPVAVALDPDNWRSVWVVDGATETVWHSSDASDVSVPWVDITGDPSAGGLDPGGPGAKALNTVAFVPGAASSIIAVGADDGVYVTDTADRGHWSKLSGNLPNVITTSLQYNPGSDQVAPDGVLMIGTLGRSVWTIADAPHMNLPPAVDAGPDATVDEGSTFTSSGSFTDPDGAGGQTYSATVDYGDGSGTQPLPLGAGHTFALSHRYTENGTDNVTVTVTDNSGATGTDTAAVTVNDAPIAISGASLDATEANPTGTVTVATFADPGNDDPSDYKATIRWGDGTGEHTATVVRDSSGTYHLAAAHSYADEGSLTATITVTDTDSTAAPNQRATATDQVTVAEADSLSGAGSTIQPTAGSAFSGVVATYTDTNAAEPASDLVATIDWGDATTSAGTITGTGGQYSVTGTHTYAYPASLPVRVTVSDDTPGTASAGALTDAEVGCPSDRTITGTTKALDVTTGAYCLNGATVNGNVTLGDGTAIKVVNSVIHGRITANHATAVTVCGIKTAAGVVLTGTAAMVELGDDGDDLATTCASNTFGGGVNIKDTNGTVEIAGNAINGSLLLSGTDEAAPGADGGVEIEANTINGNLTCSANSPPPIDDTRPNAAAGIRLDECSAPGF